MSRYVTDANIFIGWLLSRPAAVEFVDALTMADELLAAQLMLPECTSTLRSEVFHGRLSEAVASSFLGRLLGLPLQLVNSPEQFSYALELARRFRHRNAYDMQYLAIAALTNGELVTMDQGLYHAADEVGVPARLLR
ncbi:MAG TPA: type II toxin-antitoxin system VapC family toxin [Dehalococcoidia bacterium]|nr:type II toxin-antitoxin system VapC family toxin [Dehalococcoidia bacterium]